MKIREISAVLCKALFCLPTNTYLLNQHCSKLRLRFILGLQSIFRDVANNVN